MSEAEDKQDDIDPGMERAMNDGWNTKEKWIEAGKPEADWVDYKEFNVRGELMGRIQDQSGMLNRYKSELDEVKQVVKDLTDMQDKIADREYNRIMSQLKSQKAQAITDSDGETVAEIDEQMDKLREQKAEMDRPAVQPRPVPQDIHPDVKNFLENPSNGWYHSDSFLRNAFNGACADIARANPGMQPREVVAAAEAQVREAVPHKFGVRQSVDRGDSNQSGTKAKSKRVLTDEEQAAGKRFIKVGVFKNMDEYIEQLDAIGE